MPRGYGAPGVALGIGIGLKPPILQCSIGELGSAGIPRGGSLLIKKAWPIRNGASTKCQTRAKRWERNQGTGQPLRSCEGGPQ